MNSNIDQEVIDELIAMLEDHIAGGLKPQAAAPAAEPEAEEAIPGVEASEEAPAADEDEEDMKKLMEMYSKG